MFFVNVNFIICQCTWTFLCVSHSYLTLIWLHHFITYILGSLTFKRMLEFWGHIYKPWDFIHNLSKWFMFTQDYVVQDLMNLVDMPRYWFRSLQVAFIKYLFTYDLCVNMELGKGTQFNVPWTTLNLIINFIIVFFRFGRP